jgi:hypothetical protein
MDVAETAAILGTSQTVEVWEKAFATRSSAVVSSGWVAVLTEAAATAQSE